MALRYIIILLHGPKEFSRNYNVLLYGGVTLLYVMRRVYVQSEVCVGLQSNIYLSVVMSLPYISVLVSLYLPVVNLHVYILL